MPHSVRLLLGLVFFTILPGPAWAAPIPITLATAGPGNLSHLPVDLIKKIGADRAEGVDLTVRYFGGGPLAFKDMLEKNADFAVAGAPALAGLRQRGEPVVSIAAVNRVPTFVLMVRTSLKGKVKKIADLQGRVIGVNTSSAKTRSTSQQVAEFALRQAGVPLTRVNFVPAGQSLEDQLASLDSGAVDAIMGDEPFASRLRETGKVYFLMDLHDLKACRAAMGGLFLNAQLATRTDIIRTDPDKAERMVRVLRRTLLWIAAHSAEEIGAQLGLDDPAARAALVQTLRRHKAIYSPEGAFTREQVRVAEQFYRVNNAADPKAAEFSFDAMIETRWAGMAEQ